MPIHRHPSRIVALDAARGIAVAGMFAQHFVPDERVSNVVSGNTTLLFVLCGGISLSLLARNSGERGEPRTMLNARILARAVFIDVLGYALIMLNTPYGVILPAYAVLFVLSLALLGRSTRTLWVTFVVLLVAAPPVMIVGGSLLAHTALLLDLGGGPMSAIALAPAFVLGMALGRANLGHVRTILSLLIGGAVALAAGMVLGRFVLPSVDTAFTTWYLDAFGAAPMDPPDQNLPWPLNTATPLWNALFWTAPHSASTFQTTTGLGVSSIVLGAVAAIARIAPRILVPAAWIGRVPLTLYALQFVVAWFLSLVVGVELATDVPAIGWAVFVGLLLVGIAMAPLPHGPLEGLMRRFERAFSIRGRAVAPQDDRVVESIGGVR